MDEEYVVLYKRTKNSRVWHLLEIDGKVIVNTEEAYEGYATMRDSGYQAKVARVVEDGNKEGKGYYYVFREKGGR